MKEPVSDIIVFRISGQASETFVDAKVVATILNGIQKAVNAIGLDQQGRFDSMPQYLPKILEKQFSVRCLIPRPGSYELPLQIPQADDSVVPHTTKSISAILLDCIRGIAQNTAEPFGVIKNRALRLSAFKGIQSMAPKVGSRWKLMIRNDSDLPIEFTSETNRSAKQVEKKLRRHEAQVTTITGQLQAMDFAAKKITLLYPETSQELACFYEDATELELLESRREYVQVSGTVVVDDRGMPTKIQDVENIQSLDLSELEIEEIAYADRRIHFKHPLSLKPELTESKQFLCLEFSDLDIDVIACTRDELWDELQEQVYMLWTEYALANDQDLTPSAQALKKRLRNALEEKGA